MNDYKQCERKVRDIDAESRAALPEKIISFIDQCMQKPHAHSYLIAVLHEIQDHFGYLSIEKLEAVSQLMQIPAAKISGVASFYHYFQLKPQGRFVISVCIGTACYVKGATQVVNKLKEELGIELGETTIDGLFMLEAARCLGTCALAPIVKIDERIYPRVTPDQIPAILERYIEKEREEKGKI